VRSQELFLRAALVWSKPEAWATSLLFPGPVSKVLYMVFVSNKHNDISYIMKTI
jgi:hypothetical protein